MTTEYEEVVFEFYPLLLLSSMEIIKFCVTRCAMNMIYATFSLKDLY